MQITMKHHTSIRYTSEQLKSLRQRIQIVSSAPVNFFYKGEKLEIDHIGVHLVERRYGFDLTFAEVEGFPEIPEGHDVTLDLISVYGEPDSERYIGCFNLEIAPPSLKRRFQEYFTKDILPVPLSSTLGDITEDVAELAALSGYTKWYFGKTHTEYEIQLDPHLAAVGNTPEQVHSEFLRGVAMAARYPDTTRYLNGCLSYGRTGKCQ